MLSMIVIAEIYPWPTLTLSSSSVIISCQFYMIFHITIPQKPVQNMSSRYFANIEGEEGVKWELGLPFFNREIEIGFLGTGSLKVRMENKILR